MQYGEKEAKILVVDDDPDTVGLIKIGLEVRNYKVVAASNGEEALSLISSENPDLAIIDIMMPKIDGMEVCRQVKGNFFTSQIPIILLTARGHIDDKVQGLSIGADDYMAKPFDMRELAARVDMILRRTRLSLEASPLTGLPGNIAIQREIQRRIDEKEIFAVCYMDLDNFKAYNDRYGHSAGDKVLKVTAEIITKVFRKMGNVDDFVGHIGGDDFLCITTVDLAEKLCKEVIERFDRTIPEHYWEQDRINGFIQSFDRLGHIQEFPLMSISIAIVTNEIRKIEHHAMVAQIAAELKKYAKSFDGSVLVKDRRKNGNIWNPEEKKAEADISSKKD